MTLPSLLPRKEYVQTVKREYHPLFAGLFERGYREPAYYHGFVKEPFSMQNLVFIDGTWNYSVAEVAAAAHTSFENWSTPQGLKKAYTFLAQREAVIQKALSKDFAYFCDAFEAYMPAVALIWPCEKPVEETLTTLFTQKIGEVKGRELLGKLNVPLKNNFYKQEELDLIKVKSTTSFARHVKKYEWINSRYGNKNPYTLAQAQEKQKHLLTNTTSKKLLAAEKKQKAELKKTIAYSKKLLGKKKPLIDLMQFLIFYRTHRTDIINRAIYYYIPALEKLAQQKNIPYLHLTHCLREEIEGTLPSTEKMIQRITHHAIVMYQGTIAIHEGNDAKEIIRYFAEDTSQITQLKGQTACAGTITGIVKIIYTEKDFHKITNGDILVTSMTTPNMIAIMKKAAAFITDEGGITCHAAIIARELKKPCIIGTRIATKALVDEQRVMVDANKGIVTILP